MEEERRSSMLEKAWRMRDRIGWVGVSDAECLRRYMKRCKHQAKYVRTHPEVLARNTRRWRAWRASASQLLAISDDIFA